MKCPLLREQYREIGKKEVCEWADCLKEECAWWDKEHKECGMLSLIDEITRLDYYLGEILKKMPTEAKFRK